nr:MAG TPA: minor tail protein [Caudoviricetes sp.]
MATKKITIPVGFQFDDVTGELANVRKSLSNIKINTNLGDSYSKAFSRAEKEIEKLQQRAARGFSSQSDIDAYSTGLNNVLNALERIQTLSGKIKFSDLNLNGEQLKQWNSLKNSLQNATQILNNFKRNQINGLFQNNEQFASTMKNIVGLTEQTYTSYGELTSRINSTTKALQNQEVQQQKNLELAQAQLATYQGAKKNGGIEGIASQYGHQNKDGKWSFNANQGKENSAGRTALLDYGKQAGVFSDDDIKRMNSANVSLQTIVNTFNNQLSSAIQKAKQDIQDYQTALEQNKQKFEAVKAAMEQLDSALNNGSIQKAQKAYNDAKVALDNFEQSTTNAAQGQAQMRAAMTTSTNQLKSYKAELASFRSQLDTMQSADNLFNSLTSSVKQLVGFGAVLTQVRRGIQLAVSQIQELDSAMNGISVVTNMSTAELWGQIDTYMAIAKQYGVTTEGTYQVSQLYYQMGLDTNSVMELTTETLKMAKIANLDYASATDYMTTAMNGFQMAASDAGRIVDVYSELAGIAATDTSELAVAMSKTAAIANSAGMSFEATSAMLTQMIESTREAPEALGTSLKTVIARMQEMKSNPTQLIEVDGETASLNKMDTALSSVGIKLKDASGQFRNLDEVIFELSKIWDTLDRNTQRWIANTAAGSRQQSRFISLLSDSERLQELYTAALDSEDAALVQYSKSLDSMESKLNQLSTSFQQFYMQIFNGETLKAAVEYLTQFVDKLNEVGPVGAIAIVGSLISALGSIGMAMSTKIAAAYKTSKEYLDGRKAEIQAIGDSWWDGFVASFVPKVQTATNQAVQILQNAQTQVQGGTGTPSTTGTPHRRSGRNDGKARGSIPSTNALDNATKSENKYADATKRAMTGLTKFAPAISLVSTLLYSNADAADKASVTIARIGSFAKIGAGIAQVYSGQVVSGITTIVSGLAQLIGLEETAGEKLSRLKKDAEKANIARAESKTNLTTLDSTYKKYIRLRDAQYESNEAYEEWISYNQQIISDYPELATTYDSQGTLIAKLAEKYDALKQSADLAYKSQKKISQDADAEVASQPLYKFTAAGVGNQSDKTVQSILASVGEATTQEEARNYLFQELTGMSYDDAMSEWEKNYGNRSYAEASEYSQMPIFPYLSMPKRLAELAESDNPQQYWKDNDFESLMGLTLDDFLNIWNHYQEILQAGSATLYKDATTNIDEAVNELDSSYSDIQKTILKTYLQNQLNTLYTAGELTVEKFAELYNPSAINGFVQAAISTQTQEGGFLQKYTDEQLKNLQDIQANIANYSLAAYTALSHEERGALSDIYGISIDDFLEPITLYQKKISALSGLDNIGKEEQGKIKDTLISLPTNILQNYFGSLSALTKLSTIEGTDKDTVISGYIDFFSELSQMGLDYATLSSLLTDADFTTRSGILSFADSLEKIGVSLTSVDLSKIANLIPISMADAEQGLTNLSTQLTAAADVIKDLIGTDTAKQVAAMQQISSLVGDTMKVKGEEYKTSDVLSYIMSGQDVTGEFQEAIYDLFIHQAKVTYSQILDELAEAQDANTDEGKKNLEAIATYKTMLDNIDHIVEKNIGQRASNIVTVAEELLQDILSGKTASISTNDRQALMQAGNEGITIAKMLEQTSTGTWTLKKDVTISQFAAAIQDLIEHGIEGPGIQLIKDILAGNQEAFAQAAQQSDYEKFIQPLIDGVSDSGQIAIDESFRQTLKDSGLYDIFSKLFDENALTAITGEYDFTGTVKQYFDMIEQVIQKIFFGDDQTQMLAAFKAYRAKYEAGLEQSRSYYAADQELDKALKPNISSAEVVEITKALIECTGSADDAREAIKRFGLEANKDFFQTADGKYGLTTIGKEKIGISNLEDRQAVLKKINELQGQSTGLTLEEIQKNQDLLAIYKAQLQVLNERQQKVATDSDNANELLDAPEEFAKNVISLGDSLKQLGKTGYIEIETLSNYMRNLGDNSEFVKTLGKELDLPAESIGNVSKTIDALYNSTAKLKTIDGKAMINLGVDLGSMLTNASSVDLKGVAQQNIDMLDGMIATLEALQALEDAEKDIDAGIKIDLLTQATFADTATGESFDNFNDLWQRFKQAAEEEPDLYIQLAAHVTESITTEKGQKQVLDWFASDTALQQKLGITSRTIPIDVLTKIKTIDLEDPDSIEEAKFAVERWLGIIQKNLQTTANENPTTVETTATVNTTLKDGTITDGREIAEEMSNSAMDEDYKRKRASTDTSNTIQQELVIHSNVEEVQKAVDELAKDRTSTLTIVKKIEEATEPTSIEPTTSYDENSIPVIQQTPTPEQQKLAQETNDALEETSSGISAIVEWVKGFSQRGAGSQAVTQPLAPPNKTSTSVAPTQTPSPTATPTPRQGKGIESTSTITLEVDDKSAQQKVDNFLKENDGKVISFKAEADTKQTIASADEATQEIEGQDPVVNIDGDPADALAETQYAVGVINNSNGTINVGADASAVYEAVNDLRNNLSGVNIDVNLIPTVAAIGKKGGKGGGQTYTARASGGGVPKTEQSLVGELGPELVVHDNSYRIVGQYGAEFVKLNRGDVVFNASDTARLLQNKSGVRGTALVNGTGPAYGSGLSGAIGALKEARAAWSSILNSVPDMLKKGSGGGGGGGGGGDESEKEYLMQLEKWFNWLRRIEELENRITVLRAKRENLKDGKQYADSIYDENAYLKKQSELYAGLIEEQKAYRKQLRDDYLKNYSKYFYFIGDAIQINSDAILADTKNNEELGDKIQDLIDDYKDVTEQITDNTEKLEENKTQMDENIKILRDKYIDMENEILDALKNMYQQEIDNKQKALDEMQKADQAYLDSLKKNLDKEKNLREKSKTQEEKQTLQRKIALLSRDTSGKNAKELADLRQQLRDMQEEQYFNDREDAITSAEDATQAQQDALQKEIDNLTEANQIKLDNMKLYWAEVEDIINQGSENILSFLQAYSDSYMEMSKIQQEDYVSTWKQTIDAALEYAKDMKKQFDEIIAATTEALRKSDADTTGGLDSGSSNNSSGGSGGGSGGALKPGSGKDSGKDNKISDNTLMNNFKKFYELQIKSLQIAKERAEADYKAKQEAANNRGQSGYSSKNNKTIKKTTSGGKRTIQRSFSKYASGGYVDYTGLAWVDGTPSKPETFLSNADTNLLANFLKAAHSLELGLSSSSSVRNSTISGVPTVNVDSVEINITQAELKDDADLNKLSQDLSQKFLMDIARQSGNISVSRR